MFIFTIFSVSTCVLDTSQRIEVCTGQRAPLSVLFQVAPTDSCGTASPLSGSEFASVRVLSNGGGTTESQTFSLGNANLQGEYYQPPQTTPFGPY